MSDFNQAEAENREKKAHKLADVLYDRFEAAGFSDSDVALMNSCDLDMRLQVAKAAKVAAPSDTTWHRAIAIVLHRRDAVRLLRLAIQQSLQAVQARHAEP